MIVKNRYVKRRSGQSQQHVRRLLKAHLNYLEHRSREAGETAESRSLFSAEADRVSREDAMNDVLTHTTPGVSYHKLVLSPAEEEPVTDWQEWTRAVMADLEDHQGKHLHWYAVHHQNTDHGHVHVVIAGRGEDQETAHPGQIGLYRQRGDFAVLMESGRVHSDYDHAHFIEQVMHELDERDTTGHDPLHRDHAADRSQ